MQDKKRDQKLVDKIGEEAEAEALKIGKLTRQQRTLQQDLADCEDKLSAAKERSASIDQRLTAALRGEPMDCDLPPPVKAEPEPADAQDADADAGVEAVDAAESQTARKPAFEGHRPEARETRTSFFDPEKPAPDRVGEVSGQ